MTIVATSWRALINVASRKNSDAASISFRIATHTPFTEFFVGFTIK
jgi:hypothetical protein